VSSGFTVSFRENIPQIPTFPSVWHVRRQRMDSGRGVRLRGGCDRFGHMLESVRLRSLAERS